MNEKESSTLSVADPCSRQRIAFENCLRLNFFESKCFLDETEYKHCIRAQPKPEMKKIETPAGQGGSTRLNKHAD